MIHDFMQTRPDMLQLLMAAQKGQLKNIDDEEVGTVGEDEADSELHKKHMTSNKGVALSKVFFFETFCFLCSIILPYRNYQPRYCGSSIHIFLCWV